MSPRSPSSEPPPRHPIGVVSGRTGLPQDVLRAWERRYAAVVPHRTETGRRLYTDQDLEKLTLLKRAVDSGRRISDVASLSLPDLRALVEEDRAGGNLPEPRAVRLDVPRDARSCFEEALEAVEKLDERRLEQALSMATLALSPPVLRRDFLIPLLHTTGERWRDGSLRIMHEHLLSSIVRSFLGGLRAARQVPEGAPGLVVATPRGHQHELGALLASVCAAEVGWDALYLGPNLPAEEIAAAVTEREAPAVALSLVYPVVDARTHEELKNLRRFVDGATIFVGGGGAAAYDEVLREIRARRIDDLATFQAELEELRR